MVGSVVWCIVATKKEINKHYGSPNTKYDERILIYGTQNKEVEEMDRAGTHGTNGTCHKCGFLARGTGNFNLNVPRNNIDNVNTQPSTLYTTPIYINPWNNIESFIAQAIFPSHIA